MATMASPSASSATLSFESLDDEVPMDIDDDYVPDDDVLTHHPRHAPHQRLASDDEYDFPDTNLDSKDVGSLYSCSPSRAADSDSDPPALEAVLSNGCVCVLHDAYTNPECVGSQSSLSPSMMAASDPDSGALKAVLSNGNNIYNERINLILANRRENAFSPLPRSPVGNFDFPVSDMSSEFGPNSLRVICAGEVGITTPLMEAIRAGLPDNVKVLLEAGANPNGVPLQVMDDYAAFFLRFRPMIPSFTDEEGDVASREVLLKCMDLPQISSITMEEVEDRFWDGMAPFWCEEAFTPVAFYRHGNSIPSLVEAARYGSIDIFDMLLEAGADASFWMSPQFYVPEPPTESSLSVSSPLHAALQSGDMDMLKHLLDIDFDPNIMPLANPTRCFTPLMATIIYSENFNKHAFDLLCSYPETNSEIRTPIYGVHLLHFAVAGLNLDTLKHVALKIPLRNAGLTALGHTLIHIACMPADALEVQRHSEVIYRSIHETRDLHARNDPHAHYPPDRAQDPVVSKANFEQQTAVVKFLWDNGITGVEKRDVHGNTPLHYLVGCRTVNQELLTWWLEKPGVEVIWETCLNSYGATPKALFFAGEKAVREGAFGWRPWFGRLWTEERVKKKEEIWKNLLGEKTRRQL